MPIRSPLNPNTKGQTAVIINRERTQGQSGAGGTLTQVHLRELGVYASQLTPYIAQRWGNTYHYVANIMDLFGIQTKAVYNDVVINRQGTDLLFPGEVLACVQADGITPATQGTALTSVNLVVTGVRDLDNVGTSQAYWGEYHKIYDLNRNPYMVTAISTVPSGQFAGFQIITVTSMVGINLDVNASGSCTQLPTGTFFGDGQKMADNGTAPKCLFTPMNTYVNQWYSWNVSMTRSFHKLVRNRSSTQNKIYQVEFPVEVEGYPDDVWGYVYEWEAQEIYKVHCQRNSELIFGKASSNPGLPIIQGPGLLSQVPFDLRFPYTPRRTGSKRMGYRLLNNMINQWKQSTDAYTGDDLLFLCGTQLFNDIQDSFAADPRAAQQFLKGNETLPDFQDRKFYLGNLYAGMYTYAGVTVHIVEVRAWNESWNDPLKSTVNPSQSINTHTGILIDTGPVKNLNIETLNWENSDTTKINLMERYIEDANGNMHNISNIVQYNNGGRMTWDGILQHDVATDVQNAEAYLEMNFGINLVDTTALMVVAEFPYRY